MSEQRACQQTLVNFACVSIAQALRDIDFFCVFFFTYIYASNSYWDGSSTVENTIALAIRPFVS